MANGRRTPSYRNTGNWHGRPNRDRRRGFGQTSTGVGSGTVWQHSFAAIKPPKQALIGSAKLRLS